MEKMSRTHGHIAAALLPLTFLFSCERQESADFEPVASALTAVSDTSSAGGKILYGYPDVGSAGTIAVFGPLEETAVLTEMLMTSDMFDNVDGKNCSDGLPDFAGETVMPVFDAVNAPYSGYFRQMNEDFIRETAVNAFLSMISDKCSSSAFDRSLSMTKPRAKLVLLSSSVMSGFGSMDIDYMAASAGLSAGVMEPVGSVLTYMLDRNTVQPSNIGVWAAREIVSSGVYGNMFKRLAADEDGDVSEGAGTAEVVCLSPEMSGSPEENVRAFLDTYMAAEYDVPLRGVVIDDISEASSVDSLNAALTEILSAESQEAAGYRQIVTPDFEFVSPAVTMAADSYRWMRENDRFTHLVSLPAATGYMTVVSSEVQSQMLSADGWLADDFKYGRATGSETGTYRFIPLSQSYFSTATLDKFRMLAPETFKQLIYVY